MSAAMDPFAAELTAAGSGAFAMLCLVLWPLFRRRATMLTAQMGTGIGFTVQDALLGAWTGATMNALGGLFTAAAIPIERWPRLRLACYGFLPFIVVGAIATWQGPASWLPTIGQLLVTIGRLQTDEGRLRLLILAGSPFWVAHGFAIESLSTIVGNGASMITGLLMLRHRTSERSPGAGEAPDCCAGAQACAR